MPSLALPQLPPPAYPKFRSRRTRPSRRKAFRHTTRRGRRETYLSKVSTVPSRSRRGVRFELSSSFLISRVCTAPRMDIMQS